ncbi:MAG TPA: Ig-like domain-containing protein [Solirubrobacteraceae bacterium]
MRRSQGSLGPDSVRINSGALAGRFVAGLVVVCCAMALPATALANNLFSIDANADSTGPIVTEAAGNGYVAWERKAKPNETIFCKIPRGGTCADPIVLPLPGGEEPNLPFPVLGSKPGVVYVVAPRYEADDTLIWTSTNGGVSFSAAKVVPSFADKTGTDDVLLDPLHPATEKEPTTDYFDVASSNVGIGFSEAGNTLTKAQELTFADPGAFAGASTLGLTGKNLPVEAYWTDDTPVEVLYYRNTKAPADEEKNWEGPVKVTDGYLPRLASGPAGLFLLSEDYLPGESMESSPEVLEVRKYNEASGKFEAPVVVARDTSGGLFEPGDISESPTGALYVAWPEDSGGNYVMKLWESTDGGQTFHGEREIATIGFGYEGPPRLAIAENGQGWLTFEDEGGLEVADLNPLLVPVTPTPIPIVTPPPPPPAPTATATTTVQSGGGVSGSSLTVPSGTSVSDQARISGSQGAKATGTVTYNLYKDSKCTVAATAGSTASVVGGIGGSSAPVKPGVGTYYWKVIYSGDAANAGSTSACGSEVLTVATQDTKLGLPSTKVCLSRRKFVVHPSAPKGVKLVSVEIQINGKTVKKGKLSKGGTTVSLVGLPKGTFKVGLITKSSTGKIYEDIRTFHTCVPYKHKKK